MNQPAKVADPTPSPESPPDATIPVKHELGILFVHGIGNQPEGDTLLAFGEPLLQWLNRWLQRGAAETGSGVSVVKTLVFSQNPVRQSSD